MTSAQDIRKLRIPKPSSHKWQNGSVLVIGGSHRYHGAPLFAVRAAAQFVDIVHFACVENYASILPKMRGKIMEFIPVFSKELDTYINHVDVVLMGPGLDLTPRNNRLVNSILKKHPQKHFVLDAGAFRLAEKKYFSDQTILTPNRNEFADVFGLQRNPANVRMLARKFNTTIVAKGPITFIASGRHYAENKAGNSGLTKGGTGDILAGLIAAFFTTNDAFVSAKAASFLIGKTAEKLWKSRSYAFSASAVQDAIPRTFGALNRS